MNYNLPALREQLIQAYNEDELRDICFKMRVDYEIVEGTNNELHPNSWFFRNFRAHAE